MSASLIGAVDELRKTQMADPATDTGQTFAGGERFLLKACKNPDPHELSRLLNAHSGDFVVTPFQKGGFLQPFYRHAPENCTPFIVSIIEQPSGRVAMILPLLKRDAAALSYIEATDLGLSDYVAPLVAAWFDPTPQEMERIWAKLRKVLPRADILSLRKLPTHLDAERINPFVLLSNTMDMGTSTRTLVLDKVESKQHYRRSGIYKDGMRNLRRLKGQGTVEFRLAETREGSLDMFEELVEQRRTRFQALGRLDPFMDPEIQAFYREIIADGAPKGEVMFGGLYLDGECIATDMGLIHGDTHHGIITTMKAGDLHRYSPGTIAFMMILDASLARGLRFYDIGVGEFAYKGRLHGSDMKLYERHEALSLRGHVALADATTRRLIRRGLIRYPRLRGPAEAIRQQLRRLRNWSAAAGASTVNWELMQTGAHIAGIG